MDEQPPAEEFPALYRAILDRIARLERIGDRQEAGRIRTQATAAYSSAWDSKSRKRLDALLRRLDRAIDGRSRPPARRTLRRTEHVPTA